MDRIQSRRRINAGVTQENDPLAARTAAKSVANPRPALRTALGDVGNQPQAAKANAQVRSCTGVTKLPVAKPAATTRSVFGVVNKKKELGLLKPSVQKSQPAPAPVETAKAVQPVSKSSSQLPGTKWIRKQTSEGDFAASSSEVLTLPTLKAIKHKDIAKAINSGKIIKRPTSSDDDTEVLKGIYNVDLEDDPQLVSEYVKDIMKHLLQLENTYPIKRHLLQDQNITEKQRSVLVDWLVEVADSFKYLKETLHMSVALLDRYMSITRSVTRESLQLVGMAAMFIAHKYEEMIITPVEDWEYICDNAYTREEFYRMERDMLSKLEFRLGRPTAITFLRRFSKVVCASARQHMLSKYLIELALMDYGFCAVKPSKQAAAACCLSRWLTQIDGGMPEQAWNDMLAHYSGYEYADIRGVVVRMAALVTRAESSKFKIRKMYAESKHQRISLDESLRCVKLKSFVASATASTK